MIQVARPQVRTDSAAACTKIWQTNVKLHLPFLLHATCMASGEPIAPKDRNVPGSKGERRTPFPANAPPRLGGSLMHAGPLLAKPMAAMRWSRITCNASPLGSGLQAGDVHSSSAERLHKASRRCPQHNPVWCNLPSRHELAHSSCPMRSAGESDHHCPCTTVLQLEDVHAHGTTLPAQH